MRLPWFIYLCGLLLLPAYALSEESQTHEQPWQNIEFWQGAAGGLLFHELGHVVTALSYGGKPQLNRGSIVYPGSHFSQRQQLHLSSAGFQAQWLLSEMAFHALEHDEASPNQQRYKGAISMHLAISAFYLTGMKDMPTSDIYAISNATGISRNHLAWITFLPAALDAYRLLGNDVPTWVGHLSLGIKMSEIGYVWLF